MPAYLCHVVSFSCLHFELPASLFPLVDPRKCKIAYDSPDCTIDPSTYLTMLSA